MFLVDMKQILAGESEIGNLINKKNFQSFCPYL